MPIAEFYTYSLAGLAVSIGLIVAGMRLPDKALRLALEKAFPKLREMSLRDYKVRILESNQGAGSRTRVLIESGDGQRIWGTVGVSENIIDASWEALRESVEFKLMQG